MTIKFSVIFSFFSLIISVLGGIIFCVLSESGAGDELDGNIGAEGALRTLLNNPQHILLMSDDELDAVCGYDTDNPEELRVIHACQRMIDTRQKIDDGTSLLKLYHQALNTR